MVDTSKFNQFSSFSTKSVKPWKLWRPLHSPQTQDPITPGMPFISQYSLRAFSEVIVVNMPEAINLTAGTSSHRGNVCYPRCRAGIERLRHHARAPPRPIGWLQQRWDSKSSRFDFHTLPFIFHHDRGSPKSHKSCPISIKVLLGNNFCKSIKYFFSLLLFSILSIFSFVDPKHVKLIWCHSL